MFKKLSALAVSSVIVISSMTAATAASNDQGALAPGKPAGVRQAALHAPLWVWIAGVGFVALGIGLVASGSGNGHSSGTTTSTRL